MSRPVTVLCEDKQHEVFIDRFLRKKRRQVRTIDSAPFGIGSAEQYVREQYPKELQAARKVNGVLVVMIDGDKQGANERKRQLEKACREQNVAKPGKKDAVAVFVPEPDIESWIHYLDSSKSGKLSRERDCKPAVQKLSDICEGGALPDGFPPSLRRACEEWEWVQKFL